MARRWRWPPEREPGSSPAFPVSPSRSSKPRALTSARLRGAPAMAAAITTFSSTLMPSSRLKN